MLIVDLFIYFFAQVTEMKGSLAEELYSESLKLSKIELDSTRSVQNREIKDSQCVKSYFCVCQL